MTSPTPDAVEPRLAELAAACGVATSYEDWREQPVAVRRPAVVAALAALEVDASTPEAVETALERRTAARWHRLLPPSVVLRGTSRTVELHAAQDDDVALQVRLEDGTTRVVDVPRTVTERHEGRVRLDVELPELPWGWHRLHARAGQQEQECVLVVAPQRIELPPTPDRAWGWMVQLYALRSARSWGVGDYADLRTVVETTAAEGGGAVLLNPLHAETPVPPINPSPYSPSSRRFRSALYLRVQDVPEHAAAPVEVRDAVAALRPPTDPDRVPRDPAWTAKIAALELLWPRHRERELAAFRAEQGEPLEQFAVFCALAEQHGTPWQSWPEPLRRPGSPAVAEAALQLADRVSFWCWVQLLVDEQLAGLGRGMAVGVVHDLAVGVDAGGADAWALQDALALGTTVGAPPDSFNQQGQDWGLPPWRPDRLAELGYLPFRDVVRGCLRHAGGLRIDHVMGLFRLWWVPEGVGAAGPTRSRAAGPTRSRAAGPTRSRAAEGTYVSYDSDALLGVLALEATRAGALVVGEDLGTVEPRVRTELDAAGVLGSAVLWFERDEQTGAFLPPERWRQAALATVTTHDLPTAAGFLIEEHVRVRHELGQLGVPLQEEQARAREERTLLLDMLTRSGLLEAHGGDAALAMHAVLAAAPCRLVLSAFGDAVGDVRQPNLPGTVDAYPNWRLPVADGRGRPLLLEQLLGSDGVRRLTQLMREGVAAGAAAVR